MSDPAHPKSESNILFDFLCLLTEFKREFESIKEFRIDWENQFKEVMTELRLIKKEVRKWTSIFRTLQDVPDGI